LIVFVVLYFVFFAFIFVLSLRRFTNFSVLLFEKLGNLFVKYDVQDKGVDVLDPIELLEKRVSNHWKLRINPSKTKLKSKRFVNVGERSSEEILAGKADFGIRRTR